MKRTKHSLARRGENGVVLLLAWAAAGAPNSIEADLLGMARKAIGRQ